MGPRRLILSLLVAMLAGLTFATVPALATTEKPEQPLAQAPSEVTAKNAILHGVLNPGKTGEPGTFEPDTYEFVYRPSASRECEGSGQLTTTVGMSLGAGKEELPGQQIENLTEGTKYALCLRVQNGATPTPETAVSAAITFETAIAPETPAGEEAVEVTGTTATLKGILNPGKQGNSGHYWFAYFASSSECEGPASPESEHKESHGAKAEAVSAAVANLLPATTYTFCLMALNESGEQSDGSPVHFTTETAAPTISGESVEAVASASVTVTASIQPGGLPSSYRVQYTTEAAFEADGWAAAASVPADEALIPVASTPVAVRQELSGLQPQTAYRYRFVAANSEDGHSETFGEPVSFLTAAARGMSASLPDGREYEMVSAGLPGDVYGAPVPVSTGPRLYELSQSESTAVRAAADGDAIAFAGEPGSEGGNGHTEPGLGTEFQATRDPHHGWSLSTITPEASSYPEEDPLFTGFSPDLSVGIVRGSPAKLVEGAVPAGPAGCELLFSHHGLGYQLSDFAALFTQTGSTGRCGYLRGGPQGLEFGGGNEGAPSSASYSKLIFQSPAPLTPGASETPEGDEGTNLYESTAGQVREVNVLPSGATASDSVFGAPPPQEPEAKAHSVGDGVGHAISADGQRVFWTDLHTHALYAREGALTATPRTVEIDQSEGPGSSGGGRYLGASSDGSRVFFADCSRLTADSTAVEGAGCSQTLPIEYESGDWYRQAELQSGNDLYEYNFGAPEDHRLTDLTVDGAHGDTLGANVQGVLATSDDGSYIYFAAGGALASGASSRDCEAAKWGLKSGLSEAERARLATEASEEISGNVPTGRGCNLYVSHDGTIKLIAVLAADDDRIEANENNAYISAVGDWRPELGERTAQVNSNGTDLVFQSTQQLTGYNDTSLSRGPRSPERSSEVFVYDAPSGRLSCASCNPSGAAPVPQATAGLVPTSFLPTYMPRDINASGNEVYFDSEQPLSAADTNGTVQDVYEWEREGTASCPTATSRYGGCVFLLSGGDSSTPSYFVDADLEGNNVFFTHRGQLGPLVEPIGRNVLYDARVDGGFPESTLSCTGSGCQGAPPALPLFLTPATATAPALDGDFPPVTGAAAKPAPRARHVSKAIRTCRKLQSRKRRQHCEKTARRNHTNTTTKNSKRRVGK